VTASTEPAVPVRYLLDVNLLVALAAPRHVHHGRTHAWLAGISSWLTSPVTESGLVRVLTTPAAMGEPVPMARALELLRALHAHPGHGFLADDATAADPRISYARLASRRDVTDVHLVDLAARHGVVLATLDRDIPSLLEEADRGHVLVIP